MRIAKIIGTGHFVPDHIVYNRDFLNHVFYDEAGSPITGVSNQSTIDKFQSITEISQRCYIDNPDLVNSDMAVQASERAIKQAGIDRNKLDYVIVAHNFGDITSQGSVDIIPSVSARLKGKLGINNRLCRAYDMVFGCPGWIEGMILAEQFIVSGLAHNILVVGSETLSRAVDSHDRNSMIFADGAGACVLTAEVVPDGAKVGIVAYNTWNDNDLLNQSYLTSGKSLNPNIQTGTLHIRMKGRRVYEYAVTHVPQLIKQTMDDAQVSIDNITKILIHQANAKMDHAMVKRLAKLCGVADIDTHKVPMSIQELGNSSVATIPTLLDKWHRGLYGDKPQSGDTVVMASVGAGMNCNALVYRYQ